MSISLKVNTPVVDVGGRKLVFKKRGKAITPIDDGCGGMLNALNITSENGGYLQIYDINFYAKGSGTNSGVFLWPLPDMKDRDTARRVYAADLNINDFIDTEYNHADIAWRSAYMSGLYGIGKSNRKPMTNIGDSSFNSNAASVLLPFEMNGNIYMIYTDEDTHFRKYNDQNDEWEDSDIPNIPTGKCYKVGFYRGDLYAVVHAAQAYSGGAVQALYKYSSETKSWIKITNINTFNKSDPKQTSSFEVFEDKIHIFQYHNSGTKSHYTWTEEDGLTLVDTNYPDTTCTAAYSFTHDDNIYILSGYYAKYDNYSIKYYSYNSSTGYTLIKSTTNYTDISIYYDIINVLFNSSIYFKTVVIPYGDYFFAFALCSCATNNDTNSLFGYQKIIPEETTGSPNNMVFYDNGWRYGGSKNSKIPQARKIFFYNNKLFYVGAGRLASYYQYYKNNGDRFYIKSDNNNIYGDFMYIEVDGENLFETGPGYIDTILNSTGDVMVVCITSGDMTKERIIGAPIAGYISVSGSSTAPQSYKIDAYGEISYQITAESSNEKTVLNYLDSDTFDRYFKNKILACAIQGKESAVECRSKFVFNIPFERSIKIDDVQILTSTGGSTGKQLSFRYALYEFED